MSTVRDGDMEWLAGALRTTWRKGRDGVEHPRFDINAADILCCLAGYTPPPSKNDPGAATRGPSRVELTPSPACARKLERRANVWLIAADLHELKLPLDREAFQPPRMAA
jgi:hypothetical protein